MTKIGNTNNLLKRLEIVECLNVLIEARNVYCYNVICRYGAEWGTGVPRGLQNHLRPAWPVCWVRFPGGPAIIKYIPALSGFSDTYCANKTVLKGKIPFWNGFSIFIVFLFVPLRFSASRKRIPIETMNRKQMAVLKQETINLLRKEWKT